MTILSDCAQHDGNSVKKITIQKNGNSQLFAYPHHPLDVLQIYN